MGGTTAIETSVGAAVLTVTTSVATRPEAVWVAVMVAVPFATAVTRPPALTVATPDEALEKVDPEVTFSTAPSL